MAQFVTHIQPTLAAEAQHMHHGSHVVHHPPPPHHGHHHSSGHTPTHPGAGQVTPGGSSSPHTPSHHHGVHHKGQQQAAHPGHPSPGHHHAGGGADHHHHHHHHHQQASPTLHQVASPAHKQSRPQHIDLQAQTSTQHSESDGNTAFLRAARAGNLDKVLEYLKSNIDINTSNANGLNALHLASKDGHVHVVTELLRRGATVDAATKKGNTALHIASLAGQEEVVKILVQHEASVNVQSQNGFTPLYMAAQENHDNVVRFLLANGANQSLATEDGFTPLAVAMQQGHDKVVAVLLENDTRGKVRLPALHIAAKKDDCKAAALLLQNDHNPDVTSKSGFTPLHIAAHYGNENIANLLLQRGADVNYSAKHNITPLHVAAKWGKTNMVSLLIEKGANIEAKTRDGLTPLHCAARSGHEQVVDMLLERGAPISSKTKNGLAPLHMASQGDHVDAARILLYHKAPVDEVTVDYLTALHVAAHCGHVRVAKLLLDRKADPNARALNGFTPLHIACKKNRIKVVELLLKHGASIEATTESGLTPLHVASFMGCMNIVIYLIQHEANPDVPTVRGETPLHLAARANQTDIIRILLRNGAQVDARAREQQTPLHIASRLGNVDIVMLLLQHGAAVDATTKDMYTALHIAAKEGQEEVASVLLENGAALTTTTKKGFTPLHLAAKYGNMKVAKLLLQRDAPVDAQGKNGVTPLHVASHYDHQNVALLLLDKGASPHATAKNGHTPLHIAARKNQMDIATTLLEYGAKANAESKAGFTPLHLSAQEGHTDMSTLLIEHQADPNHKSKNGLSPLHLCAQEDRVNVASILVKNGAEVDAKTKAGYTPLHVASHFGQLNMVRFLLQHGVDVNSSTSAGYTPLHQAAQQGHTLIINLLLENKAAPNAVTNQGQTALSIAQKLGYISVVETLKVVTETVITTTTTTIVEEKYRVMAPETMQETFMSDSEDEGGEDTMLSDQPYRYLTVDEMKSLGDDSLPIDVTRDERGDSNRDSMAPPTAIDDAVSPAHVKDHYVAVAAATQYATNYAPDNVDIARHPVHVGKLQWKTFLVSFMVDARGGAMRGCRHSGVRVIVPPRKAAMPMRITCRYLKKDKLTHPPPLMEGEALASRILELGPVGAKFLGPVIIEVPHFGSLRGKEREIVILRSDNGETWREHTLEASEEAIQDVLQESFDGEDLNQLEDLNTNRITRILTTDFPQYFAIVSRVRQEVHAIGPEGGMVSSSVVPQVQAVFPQGALTKKIKVGLQAQPIPTELVAKMLGNRVAVSPIVTVEPRRRKFHKPITLTIPVPQAANKGMINQYSGDAPTLRLLCSITGGTTRAQWEDVTGSTPLTFVNDCVSFTTTVSARFWLMDCRNIGEATRMATELYKEAIHVPFMAKFVVFAKRIDLLEARLRVFCMTDDKEDKTLEHQEHFQEMAKSRDVEVLEGKTQYVEFNGNLVPVTKSGDQLQLGFHAFKENRLPFTVRVKDQHADTVGRILFMREPKVPKGEPQQTPICVLNIVLPENITPEAMPSESDVLELEKKYTFLREGGLAHPDSIHRADLRLSDICNLLGNDWIPLANELGVSSSDINLITSEYPDSVPQQAMMMLRLWMQQASNKATGNTLEKGLRKIGRDDIVNQCIFNVELVTDDVEKAVAKVHLDQSGFDNLKEELGPSRDTSLRRNISLDATYDEQDMMRDSESVEELVASENIVPIKEEKRHKQSPEKERRSEKIEVVTSAHVAPSEAAHEYELEEHKYVAEEKHYVEPEEQGTRQQQQQQEDEQRDKAELLQDFSDQFVRNDTAQKSKLGENEEVQAGSRISKTPPPSPAEFKDQTVTVTTASLDRQDFPIKETVVHEEQAQFESPDGTHVRQTITTTTTTTITQGAEPSLMEAALLAESETWRSDDLELSARAEDLSSAQEPEEGSLNDYQAANKESRHSEQAELRDQWTTFLLDTSHETYSPSFSQNVKQIEKLQPTSHKDDSKNIKILSNEEIKDDELSAVSYTHKKEFWEQISKSNPAILDQTKAPEKYHLISARSVKEDTVSKIEITSDKSKQIIDEKYINSLEIKPSSPEKSGVLHENFNLSIESETLEDQLDQSSVSKLRMKFECANASKTESAISKSIQEKKETKPLFETIIKSEILEQQMLQQPEEGSPERKEITRARSSEKEVAVSKEEIVSRHIHTHIFSNEMDENIEQLHPEDKLLRPQHDNEEGEEEKEDEPQTSGYFSDVQKDTIQSSSMDEEDSGVKSIREKIGVFEKLLSEDETNVMLPFCGKTYLERKREIKKNAEENINDTEIKTEESEIKYLQQSFPGGISTSDQKLNKTVDDESKNIETLSYETTEEENSETKAKVAESCFIKLDIKTCTESLEDKAYNKNETDFSLTESSEKIQNNLQCKISGGLTPDEARTLAIEFVSKIEEIVVEEQCKIMEQENVSSVLPNEDSEKRQIKQCSDDKRGIQTDTTTARNKYLSEEIENIPATDSGVEKTIAVVRESLEAAQETLLEEKKKKCAVETIEEKKRSPSEFEFKISQFNQMSVIEESLKTAQDDIHSSLSNKCEEHKFEKQLCQLTTKSENEKSDSSNEKHSSDMSEDSDRDSFKSPSGATGQSEGPTSSSASMEKQTTSLISTREIDKHVPAEPPVILRRHKHLKRLDGDSSSSSREVSLRVDRKSGADFEICSSSGESHYHSFDDNVKSSSRPCSSDIEAFVLYNATSSEYESALTSQEDSQRSATSQEYHTAVSSLSSRESMKSLDSESSGHLASIEVSSEASETLIPSAMELEKDMEGIDTPMQDELGICVAETNEIRTAEYEYLTGDSSEQDDVDNIEIKTSRYVTYDEKGSMPREDEADDTINNELSDAEEEANFQGTDDDISLSERPRMKRSLEMTFHPEPKPILTDSPVSDTQFIGDDSDKFASSFDDGVLTASLSDHAVKTVIEKIQTASDDQDSKMSYMHEQFCTLTNSNTSVSISSDSRDDIQSIQSFIESKDLGTNDIGTTTDDHIKHVDVEASTVTLLTSSNVDLGLYNVCTQVTSDTVTSKKEYESINKVECEENLSEIAQQQETYNRESMLEDFSTKDEYNPLENLTTTKEQRDVEKKDIDESEEVECAKNLKTSCEELRYIELECKYKGEVEQQDSEIRELIESRPNSMADSQVSKSDSESQRPFSSAFSDEHPDSELNELLRQCTSIDKEFEDPIERPKTPEPVEHAEILNDATEECEIIASNGRDSWAEECDITPYISQVELNSTQLKDFNTSEEETKEAEIAFHIVHRTTPTLSSLPDTIPEDEAEELKEEKSSISKIKYDAIVQITSSEIPDITVTQHMTPLKDSGFHYPELDLLDEPIIEEGEEKSTPQTPASISSHASSKSSETETDQGQEYIVSDAELEINKTASEALVTIPERNTDDSARESPDTDSFEMLDKNEIEKEEITDIKNEFVIIEEIGKEADENVEIAALPQNIPSCRGTKTQKVFRSHDDDDDLLVSSPPPTSTRLTEVKYYPEEEKIQEVPFKIDSESPPLEHGNTSNRIIEVKQEFQKDVEAGKKWIEMQFQGSEQPYGYEGEYERGPLEDIEERREEEEMNETEPSRTSSKVGSLGSYKDSFSSTPEYDVLAGRKYFTRSGEHDDVSMSSLQEFERLEREIGIENARRQSSSGSQDSLNGSFPKRHFGKSGQGDDISLSSLKEFERLEIACIQAEKIEIKAKEEEALLSEIDEGHESQVSESESCETISEAGKESDSDDYEKRMFEIDEIIRQAQCNVEQFEKEAGSGAQVKFKHRCKSQKIGIMMKGVLHQSSAEETESSAVERTGGKSETDSLEESHIPEIDLDVPCTNTEQQHHNAYRTVSGSSISNAFSSTASQYGESTKEQHISEDEHDSLQDDSTGVANYTMQASTDSLDLRTVTHSENLMTTSADSIDLHQTQLRENMQTSVDSMDLATKQMTMSCDSLDSGAITSSVLKKSGSSDSIEEEARGSAGFHTKSSSSGKDGDLSSSGKDDMAIYATDIMLCSTDSLEPSSSTATHATYQYETDSVMSSSFTSAGSATMVSSTDTLDPDMKITSPSERFVEARQIFVEQAAGAAIPGVFDDDGNFHHEDGQSHTYMDMDGNLRTVIHYQNLQVSLKPYVTEVIEPNVAQDLKESLNHPVTQSAELTHSSQLCCKEATKCDQQLTKELDTNRQIYGNDDLTSGNSFTVKDSSQRKVKICKQEDPASTLKITLHGETVSKSSVLTQFENQLDEISEATQLPESSFIRMDPRSCSTEIAQSTYISRHIINQQTSSYEPSLTSVQQSLIPTEPGLTSQSTGEAESSARIEEEDHQHSPIRGLPHDLGVTVSSETETGEPTTQRRVVSTRTRTTIGPDGQEVTVTETSEEITEGDFGLIQHSQLDQHFVEHN